MVRAAIHNPSGRKVAIKIYDKYKIGVNEKKMILRETEILKIVPAHPCIMQLYEMIETQRQIFLVIELCEGKMLHTIVRENSQVGQTLKPLPEDTCKCVLK